MQPRLNCQFAARKAQRKNEGRCAGAEKGTSGKEDERKRGRAEKGTLPLFVLVPGGMSNWYLADFSVRQFRGLACGSMNTPLSVNQAGFFARVFCVIL